MAASLCFDFNDGYYLYNSGYNTEYASLSVGLMLKTMCIKDAIEQGRKRFYFLRGDEHYKYDLGAKDCHLFRLVIQR